MKRYLATSILAACLWAAPAPAADWAAVVMYHRFGDDRFPSTNIRLDQFDAHLARLRAGGYTVLPLPVIVEALKKGGGLPDKAVAITMDDAWASIYRHAWPRLKAAGIPFTVFVSTDDLDRNGGEMMTWDQIRELAASGLVTIGNHGAAHGHMARMTPEEVREDLTRARRRLAEELGDSPSLLAWPYGETSLAAMDVARDLGFEAAFGQHSGMAWSDEPILYQPRFALNETYGEAQRFAQIVSAMPLPVTDVRPTDPKLTDNPPDFGFRLRGAAQADIACYASHLGRVPVARREDRVRVTLEQPFPRGRGRINCTAPAANGRWYWLGRQYVTP